MDFQLDENGLQDESKINELKNVYYLSNKEKETTSEADPLFDLTESDDYYLMAIDLPNHSLKEADIEILNNQFRVLMHSKEVTRSKAEDLFRCQSFKSGIQAKFHKGILWILLPKSLNKDLIE